MAGTAGTPTSLVEITVSCRNLRDTDVFSKSDPVCIVFYQQFAIRKWVEYKRTERIDNTLNPDFATKIALTYHFEEQQPLKFCIYDIDSENHSLSSHDFLGEFECTLGQLVSCQRLEKPLIDKGCNVSCGTIILLTEELSACKEEIVLQFTGVKLENTNWFTSISTFLEFFKATEDGKFQLVYRTDVYKNSVDPVWKEFCVQLRSFCSGDYDRNLKVICQKYSSSGNNKPIGIFYTTVRKLVSGPGTENEYLLINEEKKRKKPSYSDSGKVVLNQSKIRTVYSFLDYIKGGTEINAFIAIDFTASNGNPQSPDSLHFVNRTLPNQYARAIQAVGEIIEDYDSDKYFPVLGFGARMPPDFSTVSHEFFVNGDPSNPFCYRVQGVLEAYYNCLCRVQLYGPTNFAPIINHVARFAVSHTGGDKYFILLMITDGIITDMPQTKEAIVNASGLPLSIIIIGVGSAEFDAMQELDGDVVRLSYNGRYAQRDIVQFVPFRDFLQGARDPHSAGLRLAREVLAEVPDQFLSYMKVNNIAPQTQHVPISLMPDPENLR